MAEEAMAEGAMAEGAMAEEDMEVCETYRSSDLVY